jgi:hypothetical protein
MRTLFRLAAIACVAAAAGAYAHHSFSATYEVGKQVKIEGNIVQFVYRNPHSFVHVETHEADGSAQRWAIEWGGTVQLDRQGVKRDTLRLGDHVIVVGRPSRVPGEYRMLMVNLTRPSDGFTWGRSVTDVVD